MTRDRLEREDKGVRGRRRAVHVALAVLTALIVVMVVEFVHRMHDMTRGTPVTALRHGTAEMGAPAVRDPRFADVMGALGAASLEPGHDVEVLVDGLETFSRMHADLRAARRSITLQSYYCGAGAVADSVLAILTERARSGIAVFFLADGFGCRHLAAREAERMERAGIRLAVLRPVRPTTLHKAQHRSHVRLAIIDGEIAYTGGFGLDDKWLTADAVGWRETNVRFTGPSAVRAQAAFVAAWAEATGELHVAADLFPGPDGTAGERGEERGPDPEPSFDGAVAGIQYATPGLGTTPFERMLFLTIAGARERLYISNPYFVPAPPIRALLKRAVARGVDVRILTAGRRTDIPSTLFASRAYYDELLSAGIRIFEYRPTLMHAKTIVADAAWVVIGGMNLDNRSLRLNDELNLLILDGDVGRRMEDVFAADLGSSDEVTLDVHRSRPWTHRVLERGARLIAPLL